MFKPKTDCVSCYAYNTCLIEGCSCLISYKILSSSLIFTRFPIELLSSKDLAFIAVTNSEEISIKAIKFGINLFTKQDLKHIATNTPYESVRKLAVNKLKVDN